MTTSHVVKALLIVILGFCCYANVLSFPFVHDDNVFILNNPRIGDLHDWREIFLKAALPQDTAFGLNPYYRPVLEFFQRVQYRFFADNPSWYHLFNVALHLINGILVFFFMTEITKRPFAPAALAILFVIHPVQSEAVACVSGISNLLFAFLTLFNLLLIIKMSKHQGQARAVGFLFSMILYLAALMVKEQAVVLPFLVVTYSTVFIKNGLKKQWSAGELLWPLSLAGLTLAYFFLRKLLFGQALVPFFEFSYELTLRLMSIGQSLLGYWRILLFPEGLHYYRSVDILNPGGFALAVCAVLIACFVVYVRKSGRHHARLLTFGSIWFMLTLLPVLNILPLINEYSFIANYEHFLYLPCLGFFLVVYVMFDQLRERIPFLKKNNVQVSLFGATALVLCLLTVRQNTYWRGEIPLFERAVRYEKSQGRVHALLGKAYYFNGEYDKALAEFNETLRIMKGYLNKVENVSARNVYLHFIKDAYFDSAHCYEAKGDFRRAIDLYRMALTVDEHDGALYNNIGINYIRLNNLDKAEMFFKKAMELNPNDGMAGRNLQILQQLMEQQKQ